MIVGPPTLADSHSRTFRRSGGRGSPVPSASRASARSKALGDVLCLADTLGGQVCPEVARGGAFRSIPVERPAAALPAGMERFWTFGVSGDVLLFRPADAPASGSGRGHPLTWWTRRGYPPRVRRGPDVIDIAFMIARP